MYSLDNSGILEKGISISGNEILGCICKVLVKDLFEDDDNLYNYSKADIIKYLAKNFMNSLNNE
mgnify:CR=1 FL=1